MADEANEMAIILKDMSSEDESEDPGHQEGCLELIDYCGLRFQEGLRSVCILVDIVEGRLIVELKRAKMLQEFSCRWSKKFADFALFGEEDFECCTVYLACARLLLEAMEEANIHSRVRNEMMDSNGPLETLRMWLADMTESSVPHDALQLYYQADRKQREIEEDIHVAMMTYQYRMNQLEKICALLKNHPYLSSTARGNEFRRKYILLSDKAINSKNKYLALLAKEKEGRESYIVNVCEAKRLFDWFEKSRILALKEALKKYFNIMAILDAERAEHRRMLQEVRNILTRIDVNQEVTTFTKKYLQRSRFPVYEEFDEGILSCPNLHRAIIGTIFPWKKSFFRKKEAKNKQFPTTSGSGDTQITILSNDDKSGDIYCEYNGEEGFEMTVSNAKDHVFTSESESDTSQDQKPPNAKDSAIHHYHERDVKSTLLLQKVDLGEEKEQDEATGTISESFYTVDFSDTPSLADVTPLAKVKVVVLEPYLAQTADELSLRKGQTIKQKMPANSMGMAYGWTRPSKFSRKQYGFYPASLVQLKSKMHTRVVVVKPFQAQTEDELSLRQGQSIKQKIPANANGMSFGWTKASRFSSKKYGFYPSSIVQMKPKSNGIRGLLSKKSVPLIFS